MSSSSLSCFWGGVMSHGGKLERCSVPLESGVVGLTGAERLLMMSRRSRAGDRPLAYPYPLSLCRFHVFLHLCPREGCDCPPFFSLSLVQRRVLYFPNSNCSYRVSPSSITHSPEMAFSNPFPRDHPLEPDAPSQVIFYVLVHPQPFDIKLHLLQASM